MLAFVGNPAGTYTIKASAGAGGTISPSGNVSVTAGATKTFTLTPDTGYSIVFPMGGTCGGMPSGNKLSGTTYTTKAVTANCTVTAVFAPAYTITASVNGGGGTINPSGYLSATSGTSQSITIKPNTGYMLNSINGTCPFNLNDSSGTSAANPLDTNYRLAIYYGNLTSDCRVAVTFTPVATNAVYYIVNGNSINSLGGGQRIGSINPQYMAAQSDQTVQFTVMPNPGYSISGVYATSGCNGGLNNNYVSKNGNTYTTMPVTAPCQVNAYFK
jgi:hypothetical protein